MRADAGTGLRDHVGVWGGFLLFSPTVRVGSGGERRDTQEDTQERAHKMLHLPFSDLPLKKCPISDDCLCEGNRLQDFQTM